jgi:hypothetical protein
MHMHKSPALYFLSFKLASRSVQFPESDESKAEPAPAVPRPVPSKKRKQGVLTPTSDIDEPPEKKSKEEEHKGRLQQIRLLVHGFLANNRQAFGFAVVSSSSVFQ